MDKFWEIFRKSLSPPIPPPTGKTKRAEPGICIRFICRNNSSFRLNSLGPLCLWQCFFEKNPKFPDLPLYFSEVLVVKSIQIHLWQCKIPKVSDPHQCYITTMMGKTKPGSRPWHRVHSAIAYHCLHRARIQVKHGRTWGKKKKKHYSSRT